MKLLFKVLGFIFIIFTTSAIGFLKANSLNIRYKKLCNIHSGMANLKEKIRLHCGETSTLLNQCFDEFPINYTVLKEQDTEILKDFFENLGMGDTKSEYERCQAYMNMISNKINDAKKEYLELNKLYKSMGVLSGIFICIFLL